MGKIKKGDLVMCSYYTNINIDYFNLTPGKYYEVVKVDGNDFGLPNIKVKNDNDKIYWYCGSRFDLESVYRNRAIDDILC